MITDDWGRCVFSSDELAQLLLNGFEIEGLLAENSVGMNSYNELCNKHDKVDSLIEIAKVPSNTPEEEHALRSSDWMISKDIQTIDVREFLLSLCKTDEQTARVNYEMDYFEEHKLINLLQLMIYLVDHFRQNNVVWGVGRGSSVSSYCLFLIGVHKIDPLKYNLDIHDFLK